MPAAKRRTATQSPTSDDIINAIQSLNAANEPRGMEKHAAAFIGAVLLALILWFGTQVWTLTTTVTTLNATVATLAKSIDDLQTGQNGSSKITSDLQAGQAAAKATTDAIKEDMNRIKERVRMLEGQKPLDPYAMNANAPR